MHLPRQFQFFAESFESLDTNWRISTNPEDPDLTNNAVAYRFIAGTATATPVPTLDRWAIAMAALGLLTLSAHALNKSGRNSAQTDIANRSTHA